MKNSSDSRNITQNFIVPIALAFVFGSLGAVSVVVPNTTCYVFDNSSRIYDFSSWIGYPFEYDGKDSDLVIRFCKDVETRSHAGYLDFGRFDKVSHFVSGSGNVNFVQRYYNGDLMNCEQSFDKMGRTAQVSIICGNCPNGQCRGGLGCVCDVTYESTCRVLVELAIPCAKPGPRVFEGFTVGFHPRSWEIVYNGMTQLGFEKARDDFSFSTDQTHVVLYMTAIASQSSLVQKPTIKVSPEQGLEVRLSGSGSTGGAPTTLSPSTLLIDWTCEKARDSPFEVEVTIPVENYDPVQFTLAKRCDYGQSGSADAVRGWAIFGIFACVFTVLSTVFCVAGFVYKSRVENQRGLDALPGMTILSACLETVSGAGHSYTRPEDTNSAFASQASWESHPGAGQATRRSDENSRYGAI
ncbi:OLC1v1010936C4 [Oldenlandia corymbosa var. corymbosa]|uniref:OLC1v1010936C4 n=1 Tax=Oldenlandia corymbosa var. corymbosa TaxID=529605 RepID=A0AAV1DV96_OLDCO|nr:OLC1v1010936C4 [Oldenlandia corymbosa var. corymbosa]